MNTSSDSMNSVRGSGLISTSIPISLAISMTVRRLMPSSMPWSDVTSLSPVTAKTLKPGPSVTCPSSSRRMTVSKPRSLASNRPAVKSPQ